MTHTRETRGRASEIKFIVDAAVGERVKQWAREHLEADPHGGGPFGDEYLTASLYFDTAEQAVFHRRGSFGRAKYRIRRYDSNATVFLERKLRQPRLLIKRRTEMPLSDLAFLEAADAADWAGRWFAQRLRVRGLQPACHLSYYRVARGLATPAGSWRLTVDDRLQAAPPLGLCPGEAADVTPLAILPGRMIVEMKFRDQAPMLFKRLVEEFRLTPARTSKYRLGIEAMQAQAIAV
jgi:hypothetical protein